MLIMCQSWFLFWFLLSRPPSYCHWGLCSNATQWQALPVASLCNPNCYKIRKTTHFLSLSLPLLCFSRRHMHSVAWSRASVWRIACCLRSQGCPVGSGATSPSPSAVTPPHKGSLLHSEEKLNTWLLNKLANHWWTQNPDKELMGRVI